MKHFDFLKNLDVLCDTNIFIDLVTSTHLKKPLKKFLKDLKATGAFFHYSSYSIFELFRGQPKKLVDDYRQIIIDFDPFDVNENILIKASELMTLYKHHHLVSDASTSKKNPKMIDDGDYILAATSFWYQNTVILTRNYSDFPRPFFIEKHKEYVEYEKEGKKVLEVYYVLEPDKKYADKIYEIIN